MIKRFANQSTDLQRNDGYKQECELIEKIMSGYNSFKFANWPKSLESHSLMQINYPKIYLIAGFLGGRGYNFGLFW